MIFNDLYIGQRTKPQLSECEVAYPKTYRVSLSGLINVMSGDDDCCLLSF